MMDRPLRLRYDGQIESYDFASDAWLLDRSRDPRELINLTMPPVVPESIATAKNNSVNAAAYQLQQFEKLVLAACGSELEPSWPSAYFTPIYQLGLKCNFAFDDQRHFADSFTYLITSQFYQWTDTPADFDAIMDGDWWDTVVCHFWCHLSDDCTYSFNAFINMLAAIHADTSLGDAGEFLRLVLAMIGRKGLTNLGFMRVNTPFVLDPSTDCEPCP